MTSSFYFTVIIKTNKILKTASWIQSKLLSHDADSIMWIMKHELHRNINFVKLHAVLIKFGHPGVSHLCCWYFCLYFFTHFPPSKPECSGDVVILWSVFLTYIAPSLRPLFLSATLQYIMDQVYVLLTILDIHVFPNIATTPIFHVQRCELFLLERLKSGATMINIQWCYNW